MHPRTKIVYTNIKIKFYHNIKIIDPVIYFEMFILLKNSSLLIIDSGGMQKEDYWFEFRCTTLRNETEWVESARGGWNIL